MQNNKDVLSLKILLMEVTGKLGGVRFKILSALIIITDFWVVRARRGLVDTFLLSI
jgi:hypothetical protein